LNYEESIRIMTYYHPKGAVSWQVKKAKCTRAYRLATVATEMWQKRHCS